ncbi:MAG TPA: ABC transporter substrate-binding protein, partial [Chloroflexota bacterium]
MRRRTLLGWLISGASLSLVAACAGPAAAPPAPPAPPAPTVPPAPAPTATATAASAAAPKPTSPAATSTSVVPRSTPAAATAQPKSGGTLVWAIGSDIANLDGHLLTATNYDTVFRAYDRLTALDEQGKPQPQLAESWELSSDGKQLKLNLRKGVQFHTGRELTSDDVKWNFLRVRDPKVASGSFVAQSNWFVSIDTPDKYTVVGTFDSPRPAVFDFFQLLNIVDPVTMQGPDAATRSVGTGPFVLEEWSQGTSIRLVKNQNYWQTGRPYLDAIQTPIIKDPSA